MEPCMILSLLYQHTTVHDPKSVVSTHKPTAYVGKIHFANWLCHLLTYLLINKLTNYQLTNSLVAKPEASILQTPKPAIGN
jgi:hypothetical protein